MKDTTPISDYERDYFRIMDEIELSYRMLNEQEAESWQQDSSALSPDTENFDDRQLRIFNSLHQIDTDNNELLQTLSKKYPEISQYLKVLNHKIEILARVCLSSEERPSTTVSLSAGGLAFFSATPANVGEYLELKFFLLPSYHGIMSLAKIVDCRQDSDGDETNTPYRIATQFCSLGEADEQIITRHIFQKQARQLRGSRKATSQ